MSEVLESNGSSYKIKSTIGLNFRAGPDLSYRKLTGMIPFGEVIEGYRGSEDTRSGDYLWTNVIYQNKAGWVAKKYLTILYEPSKTVPVNDPPVEPDIRHDIKLDNTSFDQTMFVSNDRSKEYTEAYLISNYNNKSVLKTNRFLNTIGAPPQFLPNVDMRKNGDEYGRVYFEEFMVKAPIALFIPGLPAFLNQVATKDKQGALSQLIGTVTGFVENQTDEMANILDGEDLRLYEFKTQYADWLPKVRSMARLACFYLGIENEKVYGTNILFKNYDWDMAKQTGSLSDLFGLEATIPVYFNPNSGLSDSFSNSTGQSALFSKLNQVSDTVNELAFLTGAAGLDMTYSNTQEYENKLAELQSSMEAGDANVIKRLFSRGSTVFNTVTNNGKLLLPEIWKDSSYSKTYALDISLKSMDGSKQSLMFNVIYPVLVFLALTAPRQLGANGYIAPYLVQAHAKGFFNCEIGMIDSLSIKRVPNSRTIDGIPTEIDVSISIKDLYTSMS